MAGVDAPQPSTGATSSSQTEDSDSLDSGRGNAGVGGDVSRETTPKTDDDGARNSTELGAAADGASDVAASLGANHTPAGSRVSRETATGTTTGSERVLGVRDSAFGSADTEDDEDGDPSALQEDTPIARAARQALEVQQGDLTLPRPRQRRVFTVANQKGGVGKTTTTVNIAVALALAGLHVLVVDLDPQGNASTALGAERRLGTPSVYEVLLGEIEAAEAIQTCPDAPRLGVLPATIDLAGAEIELVTMEQRESRLKGAIDSIRGEYDYVFIDCPPSLGLLTINAMTATQEVLIPIQCEYYALEGLGQLLNNISLIQQHLNTQLAVTTVLLTMYDGRTKLADQVAQEVRGHFQEKVLRTVIPRSVKVSEAPGFGQSVITYDAGSRGAMAYLDAAREIAHRGTNRDVSRETDVADPATASASDEPGVGPTETVGAGSPEAVHVAQHEAAAESSL
ncbi:ParA family protein [Nakamurella sp. DB0629]|uniref:ParA family protein n=1 Tax=Nakamurella aerolata TaxID=1656892 RepID=A0A849AB40_9ACTN|nr:ParA family protein [Nakamurella aerolata]